MLRLLARLLAAFFFPLLKLPPRLRRLRRHPASEEERTKTPLWRGVLPPQVFWDGIVSRRARRVRPTREVVGFGAGIALIVAAGVVSVLLGPSRHTHPLAVRTALVEEEAARPSTLPAASHGASGPREVRHPSGLPSSESREVKGVPTPVPPKTPTFRPGYVAPLSGTILVPYGWTYVPAFGEWAFQDQVAIGASAGTPVVAMASGVVTAVEARAGALTVVERLPDGMVVLYGGLSPVSVAQGQVVQVGQRLGYLSPAAGDQVAGPHLTLGLEEGGQSVDPFRFVPEGAFTAQHEPPL